MPFHWYYVATCLALLFVRMFFVTAGYHRYFSHRSFKTSRVFQFVIAFMAMTSSQKACSGGRRITGIITGIRTRNWICIRRRFSDFSGRTSAGLFG